MTKAGQHFEIWTKSMVIVKFKTLPETPSCAAITGAIPSRQNVAVPEYAEPPLLIEKNDSLQLNFQDLK